MLKRVGNIFLHAWSRQPPRRRRRRGCPGDGDATCWDGVSAQLHDLLRPACVSCLSPTLKSNGLAWQPKKSESRTSRVEDYYPQNHKCRNKTEGTPRSAAAPMAATTTAGVRSAKRVVFDVLDPPRQKRNRTRLRPNTGNSYPLLPGRRV